MAERSFSLKSLTPRDVSVFNGMEPRLQRLVLRSRQGITKRATSSTAANEVVVVAKVTDHRQWEGLSEVRPGALIPRSGGTDCYDIVTGRIPVSRIESVRRQSFVASLKAAHRMRPVLDRTVPEIGANQLGAASLAKGGEGVVVGIVDFGCDFAHRNFRNNDGSTRLLAIWDQGGGPAPDSPFGYGRVYRKAQIDAALKAADPYTALGYGPPPDGPEERGTHGTHVMDIAAGNGRGSKLPGVAPSADLIFVEVSASDVPFEGPEAVGRTFGDSVHLLEALQFIFNEAGQRPCAINVSLGTNGGPHDGSTLVEIGIDRLIQQQANRAVVIAASNSFADSIHAAGAVTAGASQDLTWRIEEGDATGNELEVWYSGKDQFAVELLAADGTSLLRVEPGQTRSLANEGRVVVLIANRLHDPNNGDNAIGVFLESDLPAGDWTVRLHGLAVADGSFHAWIERDDAGQSSFAPPNDNSHTLGSISCGKETVVVGSYDAHKASTPISFFSSAGPTRDGRQKPEVSAPGHNVLAACSRTGTGLTRKSGTSMAAPAVTGTIALALAEANARGRPLASAEIRDLVVRTARKNPPPAAAAWDGQYGVGRISASAAVQQLIPAAAPAKAKGKAKKAGAGK